MASRTPSLLKPTLLACTIQAALPFLIGAAHAQTVEPTTTQLEAITVTSSADASAEGLSKPYAGGQVARGGRVGILGTQDNMNTPFNVTSYTNELIQNQQARSVGDILQNNPSVRVARGFGNFQESYFIRGFLLSSDNMAYNGLYSLLPRQYISSELFERVEVLHGSSNFVTGITPSGDGIGGTVNLLPKRAGNQPLTQLTAGTASGSQTYVAADIARRFGPDQSAGIRVNVAHRDGGTAIDKENVKLNVASLGVDWRSRDVRLSADIGHQDHRLNNTRTNVSTVAGFTLASVPIAPKSSSNWAQPWSYSDERDTFGTIRGEYDLGENITGWFAAGMRQGKEANSLSNIALTNSQTGAARINRSDNTAEEEVKTMELGLRAKLTTGPVKHTFVAAYSFFDSERKNAFIFDTANFRVTNLYAPSFWAQPAFSAVPASSGNNLSAPGTTNRKLLSSFALGDTLSFYDDRALLTLGVRHQKIDVSNYAYGSGAFTNKNEKSHLSPSIGFVFKAREDLSLYANYTETLSPGQLAPATSGGLAVVNRGVYLDPYVSKQKEIGIKYDSGTLGVAAALFSTDKPRALRNTTGYFAVEGEDTHTGLELSAFGEPIRGLKILGGVTFLDAKQEATGSATTDGKRVIGVPKSQGSIGVEWDVPGLQGFSLNSRLTATGSSYSNAINTLKVPGWERLDVGARYMTEFQGKIVTVRARLDNITDKNYWSSVGGSADSGYLVLGAPRTFSLTASVDF